MKLTDFTREYLPEASALARKCYGQERLLVPALPEEIELPDLTEFAENGMGVAALEDGKLVGYLGACTPWDNPWGIPGIKGTFSPVHAHGAAGGLAGHLWSRLYQAAAEKWVTRGAASHAIALYAHDAEAQKSFVWNGFGMRSVDALRLIGPGQLRIPRIEETGCAYMELGREDYRLAMPLANRLAAYGGESPYFLHHAMRTEEEFLGDMKAGDRFFAAERDGCLIAYLKLSDSAEAFVTEQESMKNITGAFCLPEYRGTGIYRNLLSYVTDALIKEGYARLGVDFESFNPAGKGFWMKYFTDYTHGFVRRVDETALIGR